MKTKTKTNKRGISLIVLVITIIVMIILAASVILSLNSAGIIGKANQAKKDADFASAKEVVLLAQAEWELGVRTGEINQDTTPLTSFAEQKLIDAGFSEDDASKLIQQILYNYDERLYNEEILITSSQQIYALGRILLDETLRQGSRASIFASYLTGEDLKNDLKLFNIPSEYTTDEEKINYLATTSYRLENDIEIAFNQDEDYANFFIGIGGETTPFKGFFNGNNKKIIINESSFGGRANFPVGIGFFSTTQEAYIINCDIQVAGNVETKYNYRGLYYGTLVGNSKATTIINSTLNMDDVNVGYSFINLNLRNNVWVGGLVGRAQAGTVIEGCEANLTNNSSIYIKATDDTIENDAYAGVIVAWASGEGDNKVNINDCKVVMNNSKAYIEASDLAWIGGVVGHATNVNIINTEVALKNSQIGAQAINDVANLTSYVSLSAGGIVGFANPGSDNSTSIGAIGCKVENCTFTAKNTSEQSEVIYAKETLGGAPNVGGIMGVAFNNCVIDSCNVNIDNGIMIAERSGENTTVATYGATSGGIIGRLEHTGCVKNSTVTGNNLKIVTKSTERQMYCGGIAGVDVGPYHRNIITLENNKFVGNGTSTLELEMVSTNTANKYAYVGGITGHGAYIIKDCTISDTNINSKGSNSTTTMAFAAKLVGRFSYKTGGLWNSGTYFTPNETRGFVGSTAATNVNITVTGDDTTTVKTGETAGVTE